MKGFKSFLIVFTAALLANLSADPLRALWQDYRAGAVPWLPRLEVTGSATPGTGTVSFRNTADNDARCWMLQDAGYTPFMDLVPGESQRFNGFKLRTRLRCSIWIDDRSSTVLTYFIADLPGAYELKRDLVPCATCKPNNSRWATIVVNPRGVPHYSKLREE